jgi:hypothetical protein
MAEDPKDYKVGPGHPPLHTRFKKGQSGNPRGSRTKQFGALLLEALDRKTVVTIDGRRRRVTKREAIVAKLVEKSATADLRAVKLLLDLHTRAEKEIETAPREPELDAADEKVIETVLFRLGPAE